MCEGIIKYIGTLDMDDISNKYLSNSSKILYYGIKLLNNNKNNNNNNNDKNDFL